tara:strand:+ start:791 stop:1036 length:246 start_codon:yes stop_codon:yes gene_type:complete
MEDLTTDEIAALFKAAGDSVKLINTHSDKTDQEWKDRIKRNWQHLESIKAEKKLDGITSIWTTEDFTEIDAAIVKGKAVQT